MYHWDIIELQAHTGEWKQAFLHEGLTTTALNQIQTDWRPMLTAMKEDDAHWNWADFWETYRRKSGHAFFRLECDGSLQGLLWVEGGCFSLIPPHEPLVYLHRLAAAPWNRGGGLQRRFKPVGMILLRQAMLCSWDAGFSGRIGLHSLPKAVGWYENVLRMTSFGHDVMHENLAYFEFTTAQAEPFLRGPFE